MQPFPFELVSPEKLVVAGDVLSVQIPGTEGDFEVLARHAPVMSGIRPGVLTIRGEQAEQRYFIDGGFADVNPAGLTVLAAKAVPVEEMTQNRIAQETQIAEDVIREGAVGHGLFAAQQKIAALKQLQAG